MLTSSLVLSIVTLLSSPVNGIWNPIITGWNPDPAILRHGDDYYVATSSFEYFPGVPIYHSELVLLSQCNEFIWSHDRKSTDISKARISPTGLSSHMPSPVLSNSLSMELLLVPVRHLRANPLLSA